MTSENISLVERARRYLMKCPPAVSGQGGHNTTFRMACVLVHGFALPAQDALTVLQEWNRTCQPPWSESELRHKVASAMAASSQRPPGYLLGQKTGGTVQLKAPGAALKPFPASEKFKAEFMPETLKRAAARVQGVDLQFFKDRSPLCPETQTPASFLHHLYLPGESVIVFNVFESQGLHVCEMEDNPFYDAGALDHMIHGNKKGVWYLCNPVDGKFHPNPRLGGKMSRRSEESVTAWRFMVLESDEAEEADWLAVLAQMPLRIAAVYSSAGRSIHALVRVDAASKEEWDSMARLIKPVAIRLGADKGCITAVRLTRLPGCYRGEDGPPPISAPAPRPAQDAPLEFDAHGDPILTPTCVEKPPCPWTGGILQELIYLNPNPDDEPIFNRKTREQIHAEWLAKLDAQPSENV